MAARARAGIDFFTTKHTKITKKPFVIFVCLVVIAFFVW